MSSMPMLKSACENDLKSILSFCSDDLIGTRISCYCLCYGFDRDFFSVWLNEAEGKIKGVVTKFYDSITLECESDCNFDEIRQFVSMLGYSEIMCSEEACRAMSFKEYQSKKAYVFNGDAGECESENLFEGHYKQLYELISEAIPGSFSSGNEAYLSFLSDFTFRKNRKMARAKGLSEDGELLSCVITSSETDFAAILSGVACKSTSRKSGLGKRTVLSATKELLSENKKVYVIALNESAQGFYEHIGFKEIYNICFIK